MGRKTPEKKITIEGKGTTEERERERETEREREKSKNMKKEKSKEEKKEESGQHWEGKADGVWHTPHAIIME